MDVLNEYRQLRFNRRIPAIPPALITLGVAGAAFTVAWVTLPARTLYWLLLPVMLILVWLTRFGWREGLSVVIAFLHRLQNR